MSNTSSFRVRSSARASYKYYIDCAGNFKIDDVVRISGMGKKKLEEIFTSHGAQWDEVAGVYYFSSREQAVKVLHQLANQVIHKEKGKAVFLTFEEMEYIRQALINEGSNIINVRNDLKKGLFDKLNS